MSVDISPEAVEAFCSDLADVADRMDDAGRTGSARAVTDAQALLRALRSALTAAEKQAEADKAFYENVNATHSRTIRDMQVEFNRQLAVRDELLRQLLYTCNGRWLVGINGDSDVTNIVAPVLGDVS